MDACRHCVKAIYQGSQVQGFKVQGSEVQVESDLLILEIHRHNG